MNRPWRVLSPAFLALALSLTSACGAGIFTSLYSFTGSTDGFLPEAALMQGSDGNLYGTTHYGGVLPSISGHGTVYQITLNGAFTSLYSFKNDGDGRHPDLGRLAEDQYGLIYGTTCVGGQYYDGVIFAMFTDGFLLPLYSFSQSGDDGISPAAGLTMGADWNFYGATQWGGNYSFGTIFRLTENWDYSKLVSFTGTNGACPLGSLVLGHDGCLYGTTFQGGAGFYGTDALGNPTGDGTVFKVTTNGTLTSLHSFSGADGAQPVAGLIQGRDGILYGTTERGGTNGYGTVFRVTTNGAFTLLHSFGGGGNGAFPTGDLVQASDGDFYGTTADIPVIGGGASMGSGTIFKITAAGEFTKLYSFPGRPEGVEPIAGLLQASDGRFYGTCMGGSYGYGMIYRFTVPLAPVILRAQKTSDGCAVTWASVSGLQYQIQAKANLNVGPWYDVGIPVTATNGVMSALDPAASASNRFYRVVLLP